MCSHIILSILMVSWHIILIYIKQLANKISVSIFCQGSLTKIWYSYSYILIWLAEIMWNNSTISTCPLGLSTLNYAFKFTYYSFQQFFSILPISYSHFYSFYSHLYSPLVKNQAVCLQLQNYIMLTQLQCMHLLAWKLFCSYHEMLVVF